MDAGEAYQMVADWAYIIECITCKGTQWDPVPKSARKPIIRRDHGECCITGLKGSLWDPLVVLPVLPVPTGWIVNPDNGQKDRIAKILTMFFGQKMRDFWLGYAERPGK
ncbi:hypothetical protein GE09DRAFT_218604 [Coniochaeta sp. 2T2.1]|nr:hypothetical protein GE09DRAFT_218604 [Coniochaeta sp. 2T2.1]